LLIDLRFRVNDSMALLMWGFVCLGLLPLALILQGCGGNVTDYCEKLDFQGAEAGWQLETPSKNHISHALKTSWTLPGTVPSWDCGNGYGCMLNETCASTAPSAGRKFGCAPSSSAVVCADARFSCSKGSVCDMRGAICNSTWLGGKRTPLSVNRDATPWLEASVAFANMSFCSILRPDLPANSNCTDKYLGAALKCHVDIMGKDTIDLVAEMDACGDAAGVDIHIEEKNHNISYKITGIKLVDEKDYPIPGASIDIPRIGDAGIDVTVRYMGNAESLTIDLGLTACGKIQVGGIKKNFCGKDLTKCLPKNIKEKNPLPIWILHNKFTIGHLCQLPTPAPATPAPTPAPETPAPTPAPATDVVV